MAAPSKLTTFIGAMITLEGSYGGGGSVSTSTDGILLEKWGTLAPQAANDGARSPAAWNQGYQRRVAPSAFFAKFPVEVAMRGGQAYGASTPRSSLRTLLRLAGLDVAVTTTTSLEKEVFTANNTMGGYASGYGEFYGRGEKIVLSGLLADFSVGVTGPDVPVWQFDLSGIWGTSADVAVPTISYPNFDPPKATNINFTGLGFTPVVRGFRFKWGRAISPRVDISAVSPFAGFAPGRRTPQLELTIETPAVATFDYYGAWASANQYGTSWILTVGGGQYNRFKLGGSFLQIMQPPEPGEDQNVATTKLTFQCNADAIGSGNDITITLD